MSRFIISVVALLTLWSITTTTCTADELDRSSITRMLHSLISVDYNQDCFKTVIEHLQERTGLALTIDEVSMRDARIGDDTPVTLKLSKVTVRTVLNKILSNQGLTYVIQEGTLYVVTPRRANEMLLESIIPLHINKKPLTEALHELAEQSGMSILVDSRVRDKAQIHVTAKGDVKLETAVRLLADMASLKPVVVGNVIYVTSQANARILEDQSGTKARRDGKVP